MQSRKKGTQSGTAFITSSLTSNLGSPVSGELPPSDLSASLELDSPVNEFNASDFELIFRPFSIEEFKASDVHEIEESLDEVCANIQESFDREEEELELDDDYNSGCRPR